MRPKTLYLLIVLFFTPPALFAQEQIARETYSEREEYIDQYLNTLSKEYPLTEKISPMKVKPTKEKSVAQNPDFDSGKRISVIEKILRSLEIELTTEYMYPVQGKQIFEVVDSQGRMISKLNYPHRGGMYFLKGELRFLPRFSIGGRYGSSNFKDETCIDTDWVPSVAPDLVWNESNSTAITDVYNYDINVYCRVLDLNEEGQEEGSKTKVTLKNWMAEKLSLDIFAGYQKQQGRYNTYDLVDTVEWWHSVNIPYKGLDSFYKIKYRGPRLGLRGVASRGKITTKFSFAYAWLDTDAIGWWNMRKYTFWQSGKNGRGLNFELEITYKLTPRFSAGIGYNYFSLEQKSMKETGIYADSPGSNYKDLDIIRNVDSKIYGPSVLLKYIW